MYDNVSRVPMLTDTAQVYVLREIMLFYLLWDEIHDRANVAGCGLQVDNWGHNMIAHKDIFFCTLRVIRRNASMALWEINIIRPPCRLINRYRDQIAVIDVSPVAVTGNISSSRYITRLSMHIFVKYHFHIWKILSYCARRLYQWR